MNHLDDPNDPTTTIRKALAKAEEDLRKIQNTVEVLRNTLNQLDSGEKLHAMPKPGEFALVRIYPATCMYLERYSPNHPVPVKGILLQALKVGGAVTASGKPLSEVKESEQYRALMTTIRPYADKGKLSYSAPNDTVGLPKPHLLK